MSVRRTRCGRAAALVACSLGLTLLAACQPGAVPAGRGGGGAHGGAVVVASFNFPESELLAAIYGLAIRHAGIPVQLRLDLGPRELVQPALEQGLVDVVPEYLGTALSSLEPRPGVPVSDRAAVRAALARALARWHVQVMTPAAAQDQNGVVVTAATARRLGLRKVSDLRRAASRLVLGGAPECPDRPYCLPGLRKVYGLGFARFVPFDTMMRSPRWAASQAGCRAIRSAAGVSRGHRGNRRRFLLLPWLRAHLADRQRGCRASHHADAAAALLRSGTGRWRRKRR